MSRLLHAAARGARIGWQTLSGKWYPAVSLTDVRSEGGQVAYRIHPDDEHLAYGPISTALRNDALEDGENVRRVWYDAFIAEYLTVDDKDVVHSFLDTRTFLLILAEALADEGM